MKLVSVALCLSLTAATAFEISEAKTYETVDNSDPNIPLLESGGRVMDLANGEHFDDILIDTPDDARPPGIVAFHGYKTCQTGLEDIKYQQLAETKLPARERLFIAKYDVDAAPGRAWFKFTPERDLAKRFNVDVEASCPTLVYIPRSCNGWTQWDRQGNVLGGPNYVENCPNTVKWDGEGSWTAWLSQLMEKETTPKVSKSLGSYEAQGRWIRSRDSVSTTNIQRNMYLTAKIPAYTPNGAKVVDCPDELCDWLESFYASREGRPSMTESWAMSGTQNSFHVTKTFIHSIDEDYQQKQMLANKFMKPMMEEWSGIPNLKLTSFYGIREYREGHWLRKHVDREETHVISATITVAKYPLNGTIKDKFPPDMQDQWPLEGVNWQGENVIIPHAPRKIILYESAKFVHGRYNTNPEGAGVHLGAFLHYAPADDSGWNRVAAAATRFSDRMQSNVQYVSTPSEEPETYEWTSVDYAAEAEDDVNDVIGESGAAQQSKAMTFVNNGAQAVYLFWVGQDMKVDQCGKMVPGRSCNINTFNGHTFIWSRGATGSTAIGNAVVIDETMTDSSKIFFNTGMQEPPVPPAPPTGQHDEL